jgi:hypothetical protein
MRQSATSLRPQWKVKHRETREVIVGGVLGSIHRPDVVIAGLYTTGGELVVIRRTVPLKPAQSAQVGAVLKPAGPRHPWPDEISSQRWGGRDAKKPLVKVEPVVIAEVTADAATQAGQVRHGMRFVRLRASCVRKTFRQFRITAGRTDRPTAVGRLGVPLTSGHVASVRSAHQCWDRCNGPHIDRSGAHRPDRPSLRRSRCGTSPCGPSRSVPGR